MPKRKKLNICRECHKSERPAISAAKLGHANCLTTAYRELGVFNERDDFGATPIHFAARNSRLDCLVWLVTRSGVSPNAVSRNGATAAHDAAAMGHLQCLQFLLKNTKCSAQDTTAEGATVLHMACRFGRLDVVKWLMDYSGSSPGEKGANYVTPVHLCAAKDHLDCLKWLTKHPLYIPNEQTVHGATSVYFATQEGCLSCLEWLIDHAQGDPYMMAADGMAPVHAAAQAGQIACLQWLVERAGVPIRFRADDGATPAHFAAASGEVRCLEWILDHGGSVHDRDNLGGTPVHDAAEQGQAVALSALIRWGVDVTTEDYEGLRPLDLARDNDHAECAQLLFKVIQPNLLFSLTPHHSLSRASAATEDDEQAVQRAEKQRHFEEAMLAGVSDERKEAIWQSAQQKATTDLQPGLRLLLEGEVAASPSTYSLGKDAAELGASTRLTPTGSLRHSRHSSRRSSKRSTTSEDFKESLLPYKPRPVLSPTLFEQPKDMADLLPVTKKLKQDETPQSKSKVGVQPETPPKPIQDLSLHAKASPIPKRAKFLKKFKLKNKKAGSDSKKASEKGKKKLKKLSKAAKELPMNVPQEQPVIMVEEVGDKTPTLRDQKRQLAAKDKVTAGELVPEPVDTTTERRPPSVTEPPPTETAAPVCEEMEEEQEGVGPYIVVADAVVERAIRESITEQGVGHPPTPPPPGVGHPPTPPPPGVGHPPTPPPPGGVILRDKKKKKGKQDKKNRKSSFEEKIVISKQRGSKSLQNPDETVMVSFITKASNVKKSFPVTHRKLLTEDDLSSPESSDEELETQQRESFTTPGFERLDSQAFEEFGLDVKDIDQMREKKEKEWKRSMDGLDGTSQSSESTLKADDEGEVEEVDATRELELEGNLLGKEEGLQSPLTKWKKIHSLNKLNRTDDGAVGQKPDTTDPDDLEGVSSTDTLVIHEDLETRDIFQLGSVAVYNKMPREQERPTSNRNSMEGSSTEVLKLVTQMEESKEDKQKPLEATRGSPEKIPSGVVRSGSVSERLKLFGGGMRSSKPAPKPLKQPLPSPLSQTHRKDVTSSAESITKKSKSKSMVESQSLEQTDLGRESTVTEPPHGDLKPKRGSAFETITEETVSENLEEKEDRVAPLPKIHPGLVRRHSQERFRLDGLKPPSEIKPQGGSEGGDLGEPMMPKDGKYSPPKMRLLKQGDKVEFETKGRADIEARKEGSSSPLQEKRKTASMYSPLMVSSGANSFKEGHRGKKGRHVSDPSHQRGSESLALYMNSANLPHLNHLRERYDKEEGEQAEGRVESLLEGPRCAGESVPVEFRGVLQEEGKRVYIWKQKAGSLHRMASLQSVNFNLKSIFIFLKVSSLGPLLHHVFLWVGRGVSEFAAHSAYQHCQKLVQCLPGRPQLHKEFQGHESFLFVEMVGDQLLFDHEKSLQYLNTTLGRARLYRFDTKVSSFEEIPASPLTHHTFTSHSDAPLILDTPTRVFLWLPSSYLNLENPEQQKTALEVAELFVTQQSYPKWTPITMAAQEGEGEALLSHFPSWPHPSLQLAPQAKELCLPTVKAPNFTYPASGQIKIWEVKGVDKEPLPLDQFGQFDSSKVYLIQYLYRKQSALYMWMEAVVYVWVGGEMGEDEDVRAALTHVETIGPTPHLPVVIVPDGREPEQLLNLFKGKFIIHRSKGSSQEVRLYKVTGTSTLRMKATEVPPSASSLHSSHTFLLSVEEGKDVCVWAGQFSSQAERRGALVIAKVIGKTGDPAKLAEGLETPEFWSYLRGKARHHHFTPAEYPTHSIPTFHSCVMQQGSLTFRQRPATSKEELKSNSCYLLAYKDQMFIWQGKLWNEVTTLDIVKSYITHYHSWKTTADFVVMVVHESHEGETFWKWFDLQRTVGSPEATATPAVEGEGEGGDEVTQPEENAIEEEEEEVDGVIQEDEQDEAAVPARTPSTSRSLPLTRSQVTAFENVERLQADIEAHMQSLEEGAEGEGEGEEEDGIKQRQTQQRSPIRTSQTVKELSEMIEGLDSMMADLHPQSLTAIDRTTATSATQEEQLSTSSPDLLNDSKGADSATTHPTGQTGLTGSQPSNEIAPLGDSTLSIPALPFDDLLTQSEDNLLDAIPVQKKKQKKMVHKAQSSLLVPVEEGGRVWEVRVREKAPVITLMFKVAEVAGVTITANSAIFEICESLKIHRPLEDHELVRDVVAAWPTKNRPKLILRQFVTKNILWCPNPPITKQAITDYVKHNRVPDITSLLNHSRQGSKLQWRESTFSLRGLGIYTISESKHTTEMVLSAGLDHNLYTPMSVKGRTIPSPNPFCFVMKPPSSWREKDMKLYCAPTLASMAQWVHTIRLLKHGVQLKSNYIAMRNRLQKRTDVPDHQQDRSS